MKILVSVLGIGWSVLIANLLLLTNIVTTSEEGATSDACDTPSWNLDIDGVLRTLLRTHCDDQVAFFISLDPRFKELNNLLSEKNLFLNISEAWRQMRNMHNETHFGDHPQLNVLINNQQRFKKTISTYLNATYFNKNVLHWGLTNPKINYTNTLLRNLILDATIVATSIFTVAHNFPLLYSEWQIHKLFTYLSIEELRYSNIARFYLNEQSETQQEYPQKKTFLFKNWYLPIYHQYGGRQIFERFFEFVFDNEDTKPTYNETTVYRISPGHFTYIWSYLVGTDLRLQALIAFGWDDEDEIDFQAALEDEAQPTFIAHTPPKQLLVLDNQTFNLLEIFNGVVFYFSESVQIDILEEDSFTPLYKFSVAWRYINTNYELSRSDPFFYMILKNGTTTDCSTMGETFDQIPHNNDAFVIHCEFHSLNNESEDDEHKLLEALGNAVLDTKGDWYDFSQFKMTEILVYDLYLQNGFLGDAHSFAQDQFRLYKDVKGLGNHTFWFRDWLYPIYNTPETNTGKQKILMKLINYPWPERESNNNYTLSIGQLVHIWSMAVGNDLRDLAFSAFGWTDENQKQFELAQKSIPSNYSEADKTNWFQPTKDWALRLGYHQDIFTWYWFDEHVAIYEETLIQDNWANIISEMWKHAKINFGPFSLDPILYIIIHSNYNDHKNCIISKAKSYWDPQFNQRLLIDCDLPPPHTWDHQTATNLDLLAYGMAILIQRNANQTGNWPANDISHILVYDMYVRLGHTDDAERWRKCYLGKDSGFQENKTQFMLHSSKICTHKDDIYWDPYFFLYMTYGKAEVLKKFISLLQKHWPKENSDYKGRMNRGELLHFWSGAAQHGIIANPNFTHGFTSKDFQDIAKAKKTFPGIKYPGDSEIDETNNDVIIWTSVTAGIFILIFITLFAFYRIKMRDMEAQIRSLTSNEIKEFYNGTERNKNQTTDNMALVSEPFNKTFEVERNQLDLDEEAILGSGEYGVVLKGILRMKNLPVNNRVPTYVNVAVKKPKPNVDVITFKALLSELKIMGHLGKHENVTALVGAVTVNIKNRELLVALEFCAKGDLHAYLKNNRESFTSLFPQKQETHITQNQYSNMITPTKNVELKNINSPYMTLESTMSTIDLLNWSYQIANGMAYIGSKKVIHGDLAARNVLLTVDNVAKISDFGLSRQLVNYSNYLKTSKTPVPWRWMALESLRDMEFSIQSAVWSCGVTLYEIFSLGAIPYPGCNWTNEFVEQLLAGHRLGTPDFGNDDLYQVMLDCMKNDPSERSTFDEIGNRCLGIKDHILSTQSNV